MLQTVILFFPLRPLNIFPMTVIYVSRTDSNFYSARDCFLCKMSQHFCDSITTRTIWNSFSVMATNQVFIWSMTVHSARFLQIIRTFPLSITIETSYLLTTITASLLAPIAEVKRYTDRDVQTIRMYFLQSLNSR